MGMNHLRALAGSPDLELAWVCDPDAERLGTAAREVEQRSGRAPQTASDLRRVLADSSVHAVIIATPDHWHVPAALLALSAGKHVYVEKPCSHNIREGRLLVDAARRAGRVVQIGTQSRSSDTIREAMQRLHDGAIGEVLVAKAWNSQLRANIGHASPAEPPPHLDFDLWLGPAPRVPYQANLLPSTWRWFTAFGCGDAGNDGIHELDLARWGLGVETHPRRMAALGGKSFFDDDQQFPDTQYVAFEYEIAGRTRQLVYEHRIWSPYVQEGYENGNAFYGTKGMMLLGKQSGWQLFGPRNQPVEERRGGLSLAPHHGNFFEAIRTGQRPHADAETGHLSAALAHFANLATRLGVTLAFDPRQERFVGNEDANRFLGRTYRDGHWAAPSDAG
jgi:predicted dehydrogenase